MGFWPQANSRGGGIKIEETRMRNLELIFPWAVRDAKDITHLDTDTLITMGDGTKLIYDDIAQTIRRLPENSNEMSDHQISHEFGVRLRKIMTRRNINQSELANRIGVTQGMVSRYINGYSAPSFRTVDRMAKALGCSVEELRCTY